MHIIQTLHKYLYSFDIVFWRLWEFILSSELLIYVVMRLYIRVPEEHTASIFNPEYFYDVE
jgi:hypothetical protein